MGVLKKHAKKGTSIVMDPFCGRGTTLFAARALGLVAYGIDSSPVAVAIAKSKLCKSGTEDVLALAQHYIETVAPEQIPDSEFFTHCFDSTTLLHICSIRRGLLEVENETNATTLLRAAMLGCMHGPTNKNPSVLSYFSNQMPRTFSSKPDYSVRFWKERNLIAPKANVVEVLKKKLERISTESISDIGDFQSVHLGDSRLIKTLPEKDTNFSIVVTSPPYFGMRTYVEDQWLRNWFLGGSDHVGYGKNTKVNHAGKESFSQSLGEVWRNMARSKADSLDMYIRFGIIPSSRVDAKELMLGSLEDSGCKWGVVSIKTAKTANAGKRQANQMTASSSAAVEFDFHVKRI